MSSHQKRNYTTILFDADETLFDFPRTEQFAFFKAFESFGVDISEKQYEGYREINEQLWLQYARGEVKLDHLKRERFASFFKKYGMTIDPDQFSSQFIKHLGEGSFLLDGSEELCRSLISDGFRLAIITNGIKEVQQSRISRSPLHNMLQDIIISEVAGFQKPDPRFFEYTLSQLKITNRSECLIVGDSLQADILGGINAGIDTCWFNPKGIVNESLMVPTYEITEIEHLRRYI